jgi:hypothetical protein
MTSKEHIIYLILNLAKKFNNQREKSFRQLLEETNYFKIQHQIKEKDILETVNKYPEVLLSWMQWSANKRVTSGWFLIEENGEYIVSYYPHSEANQTLKTRDGHKACAYFILKEIDGLKEVVGSKKLLKKSYEQ